MKVGDLVLYTFGSSSKLVSTYRRLGVIIEKKEYSDFTILLSSKEVVHAHGDELTLIKACKQKK